MYADSIIKSKLSAIQDLVISKRPKAQQFNLHFFSTEESQFYSSKLQERTFYNDKNKIWEIKDLTQVDLNFIENEKIVCQNNFLYWATHYVFIRSEAEESQTDIISLFKPWISQLIIHDMWSEAEERGFAIMMLYLKARQLGVSLFNELAIAHRVQFYSHINALIASSDPDKTKKMAGMMKLAWEKQPVWLLAPQEYRISESKEVWATFINGSSVTCQHGTAMSGVARGETPNVFHGSELPDWRNPSEDVDASLLNAFHETPRSFFVLESTAKGKTGKGKYWYDKYKYAEKWYPRNKTRLRPTFLPWIVGVDIYPTATWARQHVQDMATWKPKEVTEDHAKRCREYVAETPLLRKYLGRNYEVPKAQLYWWETTRQEFEERGELYKFLEEMPATPEEAFQISGLTLFSVAQVEWLHNHTRPLADWHGGPAVFGIIGDGIPVEDEPLLREIDSTRPYITIKVDWDFDSEPKVYRFMPLKHDPDLWNSRLFIYEMPNSIDLYATAIDGSEGLEGEGDNSVIQVIKKMSSINPAEQVAEFCTNSLSIAELLPFSLAIGTLYSQVSQNSINQCRQVIETAFGGFGLQHQLRLAGWREFHFWSGAYMDIKRKTPGKMGWETNRWTRPLLMTQCIKAIKDGAYRINSHRCIDELASMQRGKDNDKIEAKGDDCDDRAVSSLFGFFSLHDWELYLMGQNDPRAIKMFSQFGTEMPQEEVQASSLNEAIVRVEKRRETIGLSLGHIYNAKLPTLDDNL